MQTDIRSYQDLKVWQMAMELAVACYEVTREFPVDERYGMTSQMRRAAASVAANIAEGYGREQKGSFIHSLRIAQGSLKEFETHTILAGRVGLLDLDRARPILARCDEIGRMLRALIRKLQEAP